MSSLFLVLIGMLSAANGMVLGGMLNALGKKTVGQKSLVSDFMESNVIALQAESSLEEAAELLLAKKIRGAPVVDESGRLVGVLSQFDFLYQAAGRRAPGRGTGARSDRFVQNSPRWDKMQAQKVSEAMSSTPLTIGPDTTMQDAAAMLIENKIGRLIVVDEEEQLVGLLSCTDMMRLVLDGDLELTSGKVVSTNIAETSTN